MLRTYAVSFVLISSLVACSSDSGSGGSAGSGPDGGGGMAGDAGDGSAGKDGGKDGGGDAKDGSADGPEVKPADATPDDGSPPDAGPCGMQCERGQMLEGAQRASFDRFKAGAKAAVTFIPNRTGKIEQIGVPWRIDASNGAGSFGEYSFELQTNGSDDFPSGNALASALNVSPSTSMAGKTDGVIQVSLSAAVTSGQTYHLVITNTDLNPAQNWSSLSVLSTPVVPWDGALSFGARIAYRDSTEWKPWSETTNPWNSSGSMDENGGHVAVRISWEGAMVSGDPYQAAAMTDPGVIQAASKVGQQISWTGQPTVIRKLALSVTKEGSPAALFWHFEKTGSGELGMGQLATDSAVSATGPATWVQVKLQEPVTLETGGIYRLWFDSPDSKGSDRYLVHPVYGPADDLQWIETGWGGTESCMIMSTGGAWNQRTTHDLSFSLRTQ